MASWLHEQADMPARGSARGWGRYWRWGLAWCALAGCRYDGVSRRFFLEQPSQPVASRPLTPIEHSWELRRTAKAARNWSPEKQEELAQQLSSGLRQEKDPLLRIEVLKALGPLAAPSAGEMLARAMQDPDPDVRVVACEIWGRRRGEQAVDVLGRALTEDSEMEVRMAAARALGEVGDRRAVAALGVLLEEPDPAMQHRAMTSLQQVTGQDFGNDANAWLAYLKEGAPERPVSWAKKFKNVMR